MNKFLLVAIAYVKSMRPYTFFVTGTAGILGIVAVGDVILSGRNILVLILLFSSYGINQVINDLLGRKEDKYNAPMRPLVSGELTKKNAIFVTLILFIFGAIGTYFLNPWALVIYFLAYLMNFIYEHLKGIPFLGNIWFGFMIALAPLFGAMAVAGYDFGQIVNDRSLLSLAVLVAASSSALCYYTFFKDYEGDRIAGKKTAIVALGLKRVRYLNLPISLLPFLLLAFFISFGFLNFGNNIIFLILAAAAFFFCQYAAIYTFNHLDRSQKALELNFECVPLFFCSLIALFDAWLGAIIFILSFVLVKSFYFLMYRKKFY